MVNLHDLMCKIRDFDNEDEYKCPECSRHQATKDLDKQELYHQYLSYLIKSPSQYSLIRTNNGLWYLHPKNTKNIESAPNLNKSSTTSHASKDKNSNKRKRKINTKSNIKLNEEDEISGSKSLYYLCSSSNSLQIKFSHNIKSDAPESKFFSYNIKSEAPESKFSSLNIKSEAPYSIKCPSTYEMNLDQIIKDTEKKYSKCKLAGKRSATKSSCGDINNINNIKRQKLTSIKYRKNTTKQNKVIPILKGKKVIIHKKKNKSVKKFRPLGSNRVQTLNRNRKTLKAIRKKQLKYKKPVKGKSAIAITKKPRRQKKRY